VVEVFLGATSGEGTNFGPLVTAPSLIWGYGVRLIRLYMQGRTQGVLGLTLCRLNANTTE